MIHYPIHYKGFKPASLPLTGNQQFSVRKMFLSRSLLLCKPFKSHEQFNARGRFVSSAVAVARVVLRLCCSNILALDISFDIERL